MKTKDIILQTQPIFYKIIENTMKINKPSHAYMLVGENTDLAVSFLSKTLVCQEDILACDECDDCVRIKNNIYPDIIMYDGNDKSIKKEDIEYIQNEFNKTSMEGKAKIYILRNVEKASESAMNSLLKFLEEPISGVYAILTTRNTNKVLPTILSRCQLLKLLPESKNSIYLSLQSLNFDKEDALILSQLFTSTKECEIYKDDEMFMDIKIKALNFVEDLYFNPSNLFINVQLGVVKKYKNDKNIIRLFLNMIVLCLRDVFHVKHNVEIIYIKHKELLEKIPEDHQILNKIELILDTISIMDTNANIALLIDSMIYKITKGEK